jgi:hypothetical protein
MGTPNQHIPFDRLADLADDKVDKERATLMAHVTDCSHCAGELDRLTQLISLMRTDAAEDAPRDVIAYAVNIFRQRELKPSLLRRIVAALTFDSAHTAPAFGVRSGQAASRQLLFEAEDNDLDLRISPQGNEWVVSGQLLGTKCVGGAVALQSETTSASAVLNDLCEFKLSPVPPGNYILRLRLEDVELEVSQLELGV